MPHGRDVRGFFMMKYNPGNEGVVLDLAEKEFSSFFPDNPFDYFFLEDYYEQQYRDEWLLGTVFGAFALLSIIITCLGIFGLTSFMVLRKTREIAIRRVAGAGFPGIFFLFSRDFVFMTLTAFCIAFPACYLWLSLWLRNFEMRMDLNLLNFVIPLIIVLVLSLLTIFLVVAGTASANPAHNLRNE
jgi:putative ABC transport system permease protein